MILTTQERRTSALSEIAAAVATSTKHAVDMAWYNTQPTSTFEQFLLDRAKQGCIGKLIGLPLWLSRSRAAELEAEVQLRLQLMLDDDKKTQHFLRVGAEINGFGPFCVAFWTVEIPRP